MATKKQVKAARSNVKKAQAGARKQRLIASMPAKTRSEPGRAELARALGHSNAAGS